MNRDQVKTGVCISSFLVFKGQIYLDSVFRNLTIIYLYVQLLDRRNPEIPEILRGLINSIFTCKLPSQGILSNYLYY